MVLYDGFLLALRACKFPSNEILLFFYEGVILNVESEKIVIEIQNYLQVEKMYGCVTP